MSGEDLQLRVAITGGTSGLGLALVRELSCRGARVAFIARNRERVERVVRERPEVSGIVGDVSRKDDIHPIAIQVLGALGGLDVLINNASSLGPVPLVPLADTDCEDLELAIATNLVGPFRLTKALLGSLAASARTWPPSAVTTSTARMLLAANPYRRTIQLAPPASEYPVTHTSGAEPDSPASPCFAAGPTTCCHCEPA